MKDTTILTNAGIDLNASLELFGDINTYNDMLEDFLKEIDGKMANAKKFKEEADMANYAIVVHSIKSDCKYFGMMGLADMFYKHELAGKENNFYFVTENFDALEAEEQKMVSVLKRYMGVEEAPAAAPTPVQPQVQPQMQAQPQPQVQTPVQPQAAPIQIAAAPAKPIILVVDDSNIVRNFVVKVFSQEYDVKSASDGDEALSFVANTPHTNIACMLLDLNMPTVNGFAVLDYFNKNNLFGEVPVSIITGANDKESIDRAFKYPIVDMLQKPFNEISVKNVVEKTMSRKK